jgi:hypothetical protein
MKRLFCVKSNKDNSIIPYPLDMGNNMVVQTKYFGNKRLAKEWRLELGGVSVAHVSRGPDHIGKHGHRIARMRLQPKN